LGAVSYLPSIETMGTSLTVYEIFSIKEWRDLENWDKGCSRSSKTALFDNNNNKHDNVYGAVIMADPLREFTRFI